jgi:hypothetical protein
MLARGRCGPLAEFLADCAAEDSAGRQVVRVELVRESCPVNAPDAPDVYGQPQLTPLLTLEVATAAAGASGN